jgi:TPR repeat protein
MRKTILIAIYLSFICFVNLAWGETDVQKLTELAKSGDTEAQFNLGVMYYKGQGVRQNYTEAMKLFRKAADHGNTEAQNYLGGHAEAQNYLGVMYYEGQGVSENYPEAIQWFRKAAYKRHAEAQFNLGIMYDNGEGVPLNVVKAYIWYSLASGNGYEQAKENLAILLPKMTPQQVAQAQIEFAELWKQINNSNK